MPEHREYRRRRWDVVAQVRPHTGGDATPCKVLDISETGANLSVLYTDLPSRLLLLLSENGKIRRNCEVVWRKGLSLGVKFVK